MAGVRVDWLQARGGSARIPRRACGAALPRLWLSYRCTPTLRPFAIASRQPHGLRVKRFGQVAPSSTLSSGSPGHLLRAARAMFHVTMAQDYGSENVGVRGADR